jgi:hypothetical protein
LLKIVKMSVSARQQKTGGNSVCVFGRLIAFGAFTILVHEPRPFGTKAAFLALEETEVVFG